MACHCNEPVDDDAALNCIVAGLKDDKLSSRLTKLDAQILAKFCSTNRCSQSEATRYAFRRALTASAGTDLTDPLGSLTARLSELPPDASVEQIKSTFTAWENELTQPDNNADPLAPNAEVPAPAQASKIAPATLAELKRRGMSTAEFLARKSTAVRTAGSSVSPAPARSETPAPIKKLTDYEAAECKRRGINPADFAMRKATALRRR